MAQNREHGWARGVQEGCNRSPCTTGGDWVHPEASQKQKKDLLRRVGESSCAPRRRTKLFDWCLPWTIKAWKSWRDRSLQLACDWQSSALGQCRRLPRALLRWSRTLEGGLVPFPDSLQSDPPLMAQRIPRRITSLSFKIYLLLINLRQFSTVLGYSYTASDSDIPSNLKYILILSKVFSTALKKIASRLDHPSLSCFSLLYFPVKTANPSGLWPSFIIQLLTSAIKCCNQHYSAAKMIPIFCLRIFYPKLSQLYYNNLVNCKKSYQSYIDYLPLSLRY